MGWGLKQAVGLTNEGLQCPNIGLDQQQVAELLDAVAKLPSQIPLIRHDGTAIDSLPPIEDGNASLEFCEAIRRFQIGEGDLVDDARVDVNGATWTRLMSLIHPGIEPPGPVSVMLSVRDLEIVELPATASGLPALTYSIQGQPVAVFAGPGVTVELSVRGPVKVSWEGSYAVACTISPSFAALDAAVASGAARAIGASALSNLCSQIEFESKATVGSLFASVKLSLGLDGTPTLSGSIGNGFTATSIGFDPVERAIIYDGDIVLLETKPVTGGNAKLTGKLRVRITVKADQDTFEASLGAALAVAVLGAIVLSPVVTGLGIEAGVAAMSDGVVDIAIGLSPALVP